MWGFVGKECFVRYFGNVSYRHGFLRRVNAMVEFVKISNNGALLQIKEVSDLFRDRPYRWDEDE